MAVVPLQECWSIDGSKPVFVSEMDINPFYQLDKSSQLGINLEPFRALANLGMDATSIQFEYDDERAEQYQNNPYRVIVPKDIARGFVAPPETGYTEQPHIELTIHLDAVTSLVDRATPPLLDDESKRLAYDDLVLQIMNHAARRELCAAPWSYYRKKGLQWGVGVAPVAALFGYYGPQGSLGFALNAASWAVFAGIIAYPRLKFTAGRPAYTLGSEYSRFARSLYGPKPELIFHRLDSLER